MIETPRLRLRPHRATDLQAVAAMWADPRVVQHISGKPSTTAESWFRLLRYAGLWSLLGYGYWAVEDKASGLYAGDVGFADFKRELDPPLGDRPEIGWVIAPDFQGKGYASEAAQAAVAWADRHLPGRRTVCIVAPENAASLRIAQKCGYTEAYRTTYKGDATLVLMR